MAPPSSSENRVLAATVEGCTLVAVIGNMSYRLAPAFKQATQAARLAGSELIVVDMAQCRSMDSTFMGGMAALGFAVQKETRMRLVFINVSPSAMALLKGLGLLRLLVTYPAEAMPAGLGEMSALADNLQPVEAEVLAGSHLAAFMYDAHETLTRADPANLQKFKDVLSFLKQDMHSAASAAARGDDNASPPAAPTAEKTTPC